ncbi:SGNH/GDSL hydrolase family protein [Glutamicibacter mishrai]|uniref:SGNH/GDSL hydrolase family protein n=1 Tax=Glutamicibacter mishrai TaxID=1775880 RepID=A0A6H0SKS9_9MICC|nr:SGNH/GDSL hydrolase family protein [Glutamicibacter mishrai]QIV88312.1 SGNH/GDSL hydrolase family protein [Glutamicibacter mishrai]
MKFLVVGDSHTEYFGITNQLRTINKSLRGITCYNKVIHGATVSGVGKLTSTLNVGSDIPKWIKNAKPDFLVLNLGQVDIELGIPFRQYVQGSTSPMSELIDQFVAAYFRYIETLDMPNSRIIIKGINLPTLCYDRDKAIKYITRIVTERFTDSSDDLSKRHSVVQNLKNSYASDILRTELAFRFNSILKGACNELGYGYFDINAHLLDPESGTISPKFVPTGFDHHIIDSLDVRDLHWRELLPVAMGNYWS